MTIRETLWEHDFRQFTNKINYENNGRLHNVAESFNECIDNFVKACNSKVWEPKTLLKTYKTAFKECEDSFKKNVLLDKSAKSGIVVGQFKGMVLDNFIKDKYNVVICKSNTCLGYTAERLYELALYEVSILYHKYNKLYDFQIRYAIVWLLCNRFNLINQAAEIFGSGYDTISYNVNDIEDVYTRILNTELAELACFTPDLQDTIIRVKNERPKIVIYDKAPKTVEDLTELTKECETQKEKQEVIAKHYDVSKPTAKRWMKKFGLLQESNADKHFRKLQEQHGEIISEVQKSKDEIIAELKKDNKILHDKIDILEKKIDLLLKRNEELEQKLFYALSNKNDYMREVKSNSSSGLNFGNLENMIF